MTGGIDAQRVVEQTFVEELRTMPIAQNQSAANEQHYEVDSRFYTKVLGKYLKYSSGLYSPDVAVADAAAELDVAEEAMLGLYMERARISNTGQHILDLGCGWGSVSLFVAKRFPKNKVVGLSNSRTQKKFILGLAKEAGIKNLRIVTADIAKVRMRAQFDRVISIEMFEHMKNYELLLKKVSSWMKPNALLFIHIFTCETAPYHFVPVDESDWMSRYFFTGGTMPSDALLTYFQKDVHMLSHWRVPGWHYQLTSEAWLQRMDAAKAQIWPLMAEVYGQGEERRWFNRWRLFFLAVAELFGLDGGQVWHVSHYLFEKKSPPSLERVFGCTGSLHGTHGKPHDACFNEPNATAILGRGLGGTHSDVV
eukprot:CAMPEP_0183359472 /NCGR_PEP_ID=MMETSP0164_2-20130417/52310_1 /TAXON_ID=221442 /ORGANISM="Coccolithus pelagicus ssp braarudi, Strain PLY182g" /LENGTH=365 /DNA_ID=CAMNT_0025533591 /DNA_START=80 /DNA_END=1178 /DNA_ORIENTATION=-